MDENDQVCPEGPMQNRKAKKNLTTVLDFDLEKHLFFTSNLAAQLILGNLLAVLTKALLPGR